jgi:hypothetical protein
MLLRRRRGSSRAFFCKHVTPPYLKGGVTCLRGDNEGREGLGAVLSHCLVCPPFLWVAFGGGKGVGQGCRLRERVATQNETIPPPFFVSKNETIGLCHEIYALLRFACVVK